MSDSNVRHTAVAAPTVEPFELHSPVDVAEALSVSPGTVRRWIRRGTLRATLVGGQWRISPADLEAFLREGIT